MRPAVEGSWSPQEDSEPERGRRTAPSVGEAVDRALILSGNELKSIFEGTGSQKNLFLISRDGQPVQN